MELMLQASAKTDLLCRIFDARDRSSALPASQSLMKAPSHAHKQISVRGILRNSAYYQQHRRGNMVSGPGCPYDPTVRTNFGDESATIWAWPSRGGVIVLDDAEAIDFEFLGLDPLDPPAECHAEQDLEDEFCRRLLLLGAKWWDSEERHFFVSGVEMKGKGFTDPIGHGDGSFRRVNRPPPTLREKRWVKVAWPSGGGLWVTEFDTAWAGVDDEENLPPDASLARVKMARTMDERAEILRTLFGGKYYRDVAEYSGSAFLRAWEWKTTGEVGKLLTPEETVQDWRDNR